MNRVIAFSRLVLIYILIVSACQGAFGEEQKQDLSSLKNVGEVLEYGMYWGCIPIGSATVSSSWTNFNGKPVVSLRFSSKTGNIFAAVYPVEDNVLSLVEPVALKSLWFNKQLSRRGRSCDETIVFDRDRNEAFWSASVTGVAEKVKITPDTRDLVAFVYNLRVAGLASDTVYTNHFISSSSVSPIVLACGKSESVELDEYGEVQSLRINPALMYRGVMKDKGRVTVWISEDLRHVCTKVVIDAPLANVKVLLKSVKGPGADFWIRKAEEKYQAEHTNSVTASLPLSTSLKPAQTAVP